MATTIKFAGRNINGAKKTIAEVKAAIAKRYKQEYHSALLGLPTTESEYSFTGDYITIDRINRNGQPYSVDCPVFNIEGQSVQIALNFSDLVSHKGYAADDDTTIAYKGLIDPIDGESSSERNERVVDALYSSNKKVTFKSSIAVMRNGTASYNRKVLVLNITEGSVKFK